AYIKDSSGQRVIDFNKSNLHVVNYSTPVNAKMSFSELKNHLFTLPEYPDWIPYRTAYYKESWGFCLSQNQLLELKDEEYEVFIDSTLQEGHLSYGEYCIKGETPDEVLIFCHTCHPSLCNDNLSGIALVTFLAKYLSRLSLKYSYRFLFAPATIGSITWLCLNEEQTSKIKHGLVVANVGDAGHLRYKKSRAGDAEIDKAVIYVLKQSNKNYEIKDFSPYGYDERQFCSPGFNLPVGSLTRTTNGCYSQYHTSADNLDFVNAEYLADSFSIFASVIDLLENNKKYINTNPKCEPQLGKRGLYRDMGGYKDIGSSQYAMLWILNLSDGKHTLLDIAEKSGIDFNSLKNTAKVLIDCNLLKE
ncbi:MAG: DUF4910 domain-containing protein, partial [bacterium]